MAKVLVIDDSPTIRRASEVFLKGSGHELMLSEDGFSSISVVVENAPDIIFIDVMMDRLNGLETCAIIRRKFKDMPIVMLTGKDSAFDRVKGRLAGANEYITKPFDKDKFLSVISQFTGEKA